MWGSYPPVYRYLSLRQGDCCRLAPSTEMLAGEQQMKNLWFVLALTAATTLYSLADATERGAASLPFNVHDLVMLDRVGDPQLSPDGRHAAFGVRSTDYAANKGVNAVYLLDLGSGNAPVKLLDGGSAARWSADGKSLFYMAPAGCVNHLWRVDLTPGKHGMVSAKPVQVSHSALDLGGFALSPDGNRVAMTYEVYPDCADLACTKERMVG